MREEEERKVGSPPFDGELFELHAYAKLDLTRAVHELLFTLVVVPKGELNARILGVVAIPGA